MLNTIGIDITLPAKLSAQQQKFADAILEGKCQRDAYIAAGYKPTNENTMDACASRLLRNVKVMSYIEEARENASESSEVTLEWLIKESADLYQRAKEEGAYAAANATLKTVGVYTGFWNEKSTRENLNKNVEDLDRSELLAIASGQGTADANGRGDGSDSIH